MYLRALFGSVLVAATVAAGATQSSAAAPVSHIYSAAQHTCLDVSTTDPAHYFLDTYGHACDGATTQSFTFRALSGAPAGTFEIVSRSSGMCLDQYRFGVRQEACRGSVPPDYTNVEWTLAPVGTTGHRYRFAVTTTLNTPDPRCIQVSAKPAGYPGPLFDLTSCSTASAQVLRLDNTP